MSDLGKSERATQDRVIALFMDELGYRYLGDWSERPGNSTIEERVLGAYLTGPGYTPDQIGRAIDRWRVAADHPTRGLHGNNREVYSHLRYGVPVKLSATSMS